MKRKWSILAYSNLIKKTVNNASFATIQSTFRDFLTKALSNTQFFHCSWGCSSLSCSLYRMAPWVEYNCAILVCFTILAPMGQDKNNKIIDMALLVFSITKVHDREFMSRFLEIIVVISHSCWNVYLIFLPQKKRNKRLRTSLSDDSTGSETSLSSRATENRT